MNFSRAVFFINKNLRCIGIQYDPTVADIQTGHRASQPISGHYKTLDASIKVDDLVVIPTKTRAGMTVVKVVGVDLPVNTDDPAPMEWIVQKVDRESFDLMVAEEEKAIVALQRADNQKKQGEIMEALTKYDPDLAKSLGALSIAALPKS